MAISFKQLIAPAQVDDVEAAQRRQAIAEAMQQRAMQPNLPQAGGPVQAKYGAGNALVDLANSLASAWNLKNANTALGRAKEARAGQVQDASKRVAMSQPNMPMASGPGEIMSPLTPEEASADLGRAMGPEGQTAVAKALMERKLSETDPAAALDRDVKLEQIRSGIADRKEARAQSMLALQMRIASDERQGKDTSDLKRQLAEMTIGQRQAEERGRNERADADRAQREEAAKEKGSEKNDSKMAALEAASQALNRVQQTSDKVGTGGGPIEGRVPALGVETQDFDGARAQLLEAIQSALRVKGIGQQSNFELQMLLAALPDRTQSKPVRDEQIKGIANRLRIVMERETGGSAPPTSPPAAAGAGVVPVTKTINGVTYEKGADGQWYERD